MYLGWNSCERCSRVRAKRTVKTGFSFLKSEAIRLMTDSEIFIAVGAKLNDEPEGAGTEFVQLRAQHNRAAFACGDFCLLFAFLQHFIIRLFIFPECIGVPASTPPARAMIRKSDVSHVFIVRHTIWNGSRACQELFDLVSKTASRHPRQCGLIHSISIAIQLRSGLIYGIENVRYFSDKITVYRLSENVRCSLIKMLYHLDIQCFERIILLYPFRRCGVRKRSKMSTPFLSFRIFFQANPATGFFSFPTALV